MRIETKTMTADRLLKGLLLVVRREASGWAALIEGSTCFSIDVRRVEKDDGLVGM